MPTPIAIERAEIALNAHLLNDPAAESWFATTRSGRSRDDGRPVLVVYALPGGIGKAGDWVEARGWEWGGFALRASNLPGS